MTLDNSTMMREPQNWSIIPSLENFHNVYLRLTERFVIIIYGYFQRVYCI